MSLTENLSLTGVTEFDVRRLNKAWEKRNKLITEGSTTLRAESDSLRAEGGKLCAENDKLKAEGSKLRAEGDKLRAEGSKLFAESDKLRAEISKLRAEGDMLYIEAVIDFFGPRVSIDWNSGEVSVPDGENIRTIPESELSGIGIDDYY